MRGSQKANLSLRCWPIAPLQAPHHALSPLTKKIFKQHKIKPEQLLPISPTAFAGRMAKTKYSQRIITTLYHQQCQNRLKLLEILTKQYTAIRQSISTSKPKSISRKTCEIRSNCYTPRFTSKRNSSSARQLAVSQSQKLLIKSQTKKSRNSSSSTKKKIKVRLKTSHAENMKPSFLQYQDETTRTPKNFKQSAEYFYVIEKKSKRFQKEAERQRIQRNSHRFELRQDYCEDIIKSMGGLLQKYMELEKQQQVELERYNVIQNDKYRAMEASEIQKNSYITKQERKRLEKIQFIEKQELRTKIQTARLKANLIKKSQSNTQDDSQVHNIHNPKC